MRLLATLYDGRGMEWRIKVSPGGTRDHPDEKVIKFWAPNNEPQNKMLLYNPKISLSGRSRDRYAQTTEEVYIPVNRIYLFANKLMTVYRGLSSEKLKIRNENEKLFMDANAMLENSQKLNLFGKSLIISPSIVRYANEELLGVQFTMGGTYAGMMDHNEVRELCEILSHTDIQVYTMLLSMMEKLDDMDGKLDRLAEGQAQILRVLQNAGVPVSPPKKEERKPNSGLEWQRLEVTS